MFDFFGKILVAAYGSAGYCSLLVDTANKTKKENMIPIKTANKRNDLDISTVRHTVYCVYMHDGLRKILLKECGSMTEAELFRMQKQTRHPMTKFSVDLKSVVNGGDVIL